MSREYIYEIIKRLEGERHPLDTYDALESTADFIESKFSHAGLDTWTHTFSVKGFNKTFKNIIGHLGDKSEPAILIGAHYDTVRKSPGANDNLSGLSVMLDVLNKIKDDKKVPHIMFVGFTLEEGHPGFDHYLINELQKKGITDAEGRYVTLEVNQLCLQVEKSARKEKQNGSSLLDGYKKQVEGLSGVQKTYCDIMIHGHESFLNDFFDGGRIMMGSSRLQGYLEEKGIQVSEVIVMDCLGWIKKGKNTQRPLPLNDMTKDLIQSHLVDMDQNEGNYIGIFGGNSSKHILSDYLKACETVGQLPYLGMHLPLSYDQVKIMLPDLLRSDHAPFWKAGIKGLFITDMANFRSELYHTPADQSNRIDYSILDRISAATLKYLRKK
ncbi:M28 family peptidase [Acidaminobacter sp. JC074]|uniref:M28 family peptidase n=1 Tax=Acidaminobacter sp. JC074 TaxID=2530199 RepID=UPI001F0E278A|nr:M28 family peptidase [Acidaminobacter sp. JC074]MCH4886173.1 M28 family peptidase [Acidaminobacter sp. JC074]